MIDQLVLYPLGISGIVQMPLQHREIAGDGVEPREGKGRVRVNVRRDNGSLEIRINDSGRGFDFGADGRPVREGISIANTRARLDHIYGEKASLVLRNAGGGAEAVVTVPASLDGGLR